MNKGDLTISNSGTSKKKSNTSGDFIMDLTTIRNDVPLFLQITAARNEAATLKLKAAINVGGQLLPSSTCEDSRFHGRQSTKAEDSSADPPQDPCINHDRLMGTGSEDNGVPEDTLQHGSQSTGRQNPTQTATIGQSDIDTIANPAADTMANPAAVLIYLATDLRTSGQLDSLHIHSAIADTVIVEVNAYGIASEICVPESLCDYTNKAVPPLTPKKQLWVNEVMNKLPQQIEQRTTTSHQGEVEVGKVGPAIACVPRACLRDPSKRKCTPVITPEQQALVKKNFGIELLRFRPYKTRVVYGSSLRNITGISNQVSTMVSIPFRLGSPICSYPGKLLGELEAKTSKSNYVMSTDGSSFDAESVTHDVGDIQDNGFPRENAGRAMNSAIFLRDANATMVSCAYTQTIQPALDASQNIGGRCEVLNMYAGTADYHGVPKPVYNKPVSTSTTALVNISNERLSTSAKRKLSDRAKMVYGRQYLNSCHSPDERARAIAKIKLDLRDGQFPALVNTEGRIIADPSSSSKDSPVHQREVDAIKAAIANKVPMYDDLSSFYLHQNRTILWKMLMAAHNSDVTIVPCALSEYHRGRSNSAWKLSPRAATPFLDNHLLSQLHARVGIAATDLKCFAAVLLVPLMTADDVIAISGGARQLPAQLMDRFWAACSFLLPVRQIDDRTLVHLLEWLVRRYGSLIALRLTFFQVNGAYFCVERSATHHQAPAEVRSIILSVSARAGQLYLTVPEEVIHADALMAADPTLATHNFTGQFIHVIRDNKEGGSELNDDSDSAPPQLIEPDRTALQHPPDLQHRSLGSSCADPETHGDQMSVDDVAPAPSAATGRGEAPEDSETESSETEHLIPPYRRFSPPYRQNQQNDWITPCHDDILTEMISFNRNVERLPTDESGFLRTDGYQYREIRILIEAVALTFINDHLEIGSQPQRDQDILCLHSHLITAASNVSSVSTVTHLDLYNCFTYVYNMTRVDFLTVPSPRCSEFTILFDLINHRTLQISKLDRTLLDDIQEALTGLGELAGNKWTPYKWSKGEHANWEAFDNSISHSFDLFAPSFLQHLDNKGLIHLTQPQNATGQTAAEQFLFLQSKAVDLCNATYSISICKAYWHRNVHPDLRNSEHDTSASLNDIYDIYLPHPCQISNLLDHWGVSRSTSMYCYLGIFMAIADYHSNASDPAIAQELREKYPDLKRHPQLLISDIIARLQASRDNVYVEVTIHILSLCGEFVTTVVIRPLRTMARLRIVLDNGAALNYRSNLLDGRQSRRDYEDVYIHGKKSPKVSDTDTPAPSSSTSSKPAPRGTATSRRTEIGAAAAPTVAISWTAGYHKAAEQHDLSAGSSISTGDKTATSEGRESTPDSQSTADASLGERLTQDDGKDGATERTPSLPSSKKGAAAKGKSIVPPTSQQQVNEFFRHNSISPSSTSLVNLQPDAAPPALPEIISSTDSLASTTTLSSITVNSNDSSLSDANAMVIPNRPQTTGFQVIPMGTAVLHDKGTWEDHSSKLPPLLPIASAGPTVTKSLNSTGKVARVQTCLLHMQKQVYLDTTVTTTVSDSIAVTGLPTDGVLGAIDHVLGFLVNYGFPIRSDKKPVIDNLFSYANNGAIFIKLAASLRFGMDPTPASTSSSFSPSSSQQRIFPAIANFTIPVEFGKLMNTTATKRSSWPLTVQAISDTLFLQTHPMVAAVAMFPTSVLTHDAYALLQNYYAKHPLSVDLLLQTFQLRLGNRGKLTNVHMISIIAATTKERDAIRSQLLHDDEVSVIQIGFSLVAMANTKESVESFWMAHKQFRDAIPFSATVTGCPYGSTIELLRSLEAKVKVDPLEPSVPIRSIALGNFVISDGGGVKRDGTAVLVLNEGLIPYKKEVLSEKVVELCPFATSIVIQGSDLGHISFVATSDNHRGSSQYDKTAAGRKRKNAGRESGTDLRQPPPDNSYSSSSSYPAITDGKKSDGKPKSKLGKAELNNGHSQVSIAVPAPVTSTALAVSASSTKRKGQQQLSEWQVATETNVNSKFEQITVTQFVFDQRLSKVENGVVDILSLLKRAEARSAAKDARVTETKQAGDGDDQSDVGKF